MSERLDRYVNFLETLSLDNLAAIGDYVTEDVRFSDPFNDVRGAEKMRVILLEMFEKVGPISFAVSTRVDDGEVGFIAWTFNGTLFGKPWAFEGVSVLRFAEDGRISSHLDRWDSGSDFWALVPVIGWLLRRLRRRLQVH